MELAAGSQAPCDYSRPRVPACRSMLGLLGVLAFGAVLTVACAPPNSPAGSNDGGVPINTAAGAVSAGAPIDVALVDTKGLDGPMSIASFATTAPAGDVTFVVKNLGTIEHEMVVVKTDTPFDKIPIADSGDPPVPVTSGADKIDEADNVAETGDPNLQPGDTRTFVAAGLAPGHYVLVCNIAKHYGLGMRAAFTVTGSSTSTPTTSIASTTPSASTAPAAAGAVAVTLGDTKGLNGPMTLVPAVNTAPAGDVTFVVKNAGTIEHEMLVVKTDTPFDKIPITDSGDPPVPVTSGADKIDEADNVAETGDPNLQPGDTRTFVAAGLAPGHYVLLCNIAKHYGLGMRAAFTVTGSSTSTPTTSIASTTPSASTAPAAAGAVAVTLGDTKGLNGPMTLVPAVNTAPAGDVTFVVKNAGTIEHEMLVVKTDTPFDKIPITDSGDPPVPVTSGADKIDEADNVAETGDPNLQPGDTRTFVAAGLAPGHYVLLCNIAKHYGLGMRAAFTVT